MHKNRKSLEFFFRRVVMSSKVRILRSNLNSIYANLAVEEAIIAKEAVQPHLFLWRNEPAVTIGRHQNPWKECNLNAMDDKGVSLARRYSGGGAVYQDMGCTTFTFVNGISANDSPSRIIDSNFDLLVNSLTSLGLSAARKGRNDVVVGEFKVSGSAFKQIPGRLVHHGTILVNTDMTRLASYLTPSKLKLQSKGIASVGARVVNLSEINPSINHEIICDSLTKSYSSHYNDTSSVMDIIDESIQSDPVFCNHHKALKDWNWRYGTTPEFSNLLETRLDQIGCFDVHYQVNDGKISKIRIFSDCLFPDVIETIQNSLLGSPYSVSAIRETLNSTRVTNDDDDGKKKSVISEFSKWFTSEI